MTFDIPQMGKVYSYTRFSDARQKAGNSVERQAMYAQKWAEERGMVLDTTLSMRDEGLSAYHQRHVKSGALGMFLQSVEQGLIDPGSVLIVEGLDRLSRAEPMQAQAQLSQIINNGVTVVTAADNKMYSRESIKNNPMDLIYSLLVMIRAHEESDTKSKRVKASIEKLCEKWLAGTYRGIIRNGIDPAWVQWNGATFEVVEQEAHRMRRMTELYMLGYGGKKIAQVLEQEGIEPPKYVSNIYRYFSLQHYLLIGTKIIEINGREFHLKNYYPAILDEATYLDLCALRRSRKRGPDSGFPNLFSGMGICRCGYCGGALGAQVSANRKRKPDGTLQDGHMRLVCNTRNCPSATMGVVPFEKALLHWCSDQFNLNSLSTPRDGQDLRSRIAAGKASLADMEKQLDKLVSAMLLTDAPPAAFTKRAQEIEQLIANTKHTIRKDEAQLLREAQKPTEHASQIWAALTEGVLKYDYEARMKVRALVAETFSKIIIYRHGMNPLEAKQYDRLSPFEMVLVGKSGAARHLRINRKGEVIASREESIS